MEAVIEGFRALQHRGSRLSAVNAILDDLDRYERRAMAKTFSTMGPESLVDEIRYDLVGSLPLEILLIIFSFLDPVDSFRLQRVSKRWRRVLSAPRLLDLSLSLWYSPNDTPLAGEESGRSEDEIRRLKLEHIGRFRTGRPSSVSEIDLQTEITPSWLLGTIQVYRNWLGYIPYGDSSWTVLLIHLPSGKVKQFGFKSRSKLNAFAMDDGYLVMMSISGHVGAINLDTMQTQVRRTPPPYGQPTIVIRDSSIWVLCARMDSGPPGRTSYTFICAKWDLSTGICREVPPWWTPVGGLDGSESKMRWAVFRHGGKGRMRALDLDHDAEPIDMNGRDLSTDSFRGIETRTLLPAPLIDYDGHLQLPFESDYSVLGVDKHDGTILSFTTDPHFDAIAGAEETSDATVTYEVNDHRIQFWKDTRYFLVKADNEWIDITSKVYSKFTKPGTNGIICVNSPKIVTSTESCKPSDLQTQPIESSFASHLIARDTSQCAGNETFMVFIVSVYSDGGYRQAGLDGEIEKMIVLCFDPDIDMTGLDRLNFEEPPCLL